MHHIRLLAEQDHPRVAQTIGLVDVPTPHQERNKVENLHLHLRAQTQHLQSHGLRITLAHSLRQTPLPSRIHMETHLTDQEDPLSI